MEITLKPGVDSDERAAVMALLRAGGARGCELPDSVRVGGGGAALQAAVAALPGVLSVRQCISKYPLASRLPGQETTRVQVAGRVIGGERPTIIAGPCTVESEAQLMATAVAVKAAGADLLRGGAFKPRTSPYSFDGLGEEGLRLLAKARAETGLGIVTEVMEPGLVNLVADYADVLQIGSRNMQNYPLLRAAGRSGRPVMVKRGFAATVEEWLLAAEYVLAEGNGQVMLCERGIRGSDPAFRFTLDLAAVPLAKSLSHLPVLVDPSHGTGRRALVEPMSLAALAAGADGLLVEVHTSPDEALCDGDQSILPETLASLIQRGLALRSMLGAAVGQPA